jgi:hypothetical protein
LVIVIIHRADSVAAGVAACRLISSNYGKQMRKIFAVSSEKSFIRVSLFPLRAYRLFF